MEATVGSGARRETNSSAAADGKFLTFFLAEEEYGIEILKVQEIIGLMSITRVPRTPRFMRGVINLRGKVIPIIDLRSKFEMPPAEATNQTCIIVVHVRGIEMGIIVDQVSEVVGISAQDIDPAPSFGVEVNTEYILGIGKAQGKVKILLNIDRVLSKGDVSQVADATSTGSELPA